jgi:hypothetical protein
MAKAVESILFTTASIAIAARAIPIVSTISAVSYKYTK